MSENKRSRLQETILAAPDKTLYVVVIFLVIIGFMAIFSATAPKFLNEGGNPAQFLIKQVGCFIIGFIVLDIWGPPVLITKNYADMILYL